MRERLIAVLVGLTICVIALYGVPRAYYTADLVERHQTEEVLREAQFIQLRIEARLQRGDDVDAALLASAIEPDDGALYTALDGSRLTAGRVDLDPRHSITQTRRLISGATIVVTRDRQVISDEVQEALLPLLLLGVGLAVASAIVAFVIAGRVSRVFVRLSTAAEDLGHGRFDLDVPDRGIPEAVQIGEAMRSAAARLDELIRHEREFSLNASHQLRTPITALRLELEDLTLWPETPPEVADQLHSCIGELDRLSASIDDLLDLARRERRSRQQQLDVGRLLEDAADR